MRKLQYKLELADGRKYTVSSGEVDEGCLPCDNKYLPIDFSVLDCRDGNLRKVDIADISINQDNWGNEDSKDSKAFHKNYRKILHGKKKDWILYAFEVDAESLILNFYNQKSGRAEYLLFEEIASVLDIHFNVPHQNGEVSQYVVKLRRSDSLSHDNQMGYIARITERYQNVYRELEFYKEALASFDVPRYVHVTECVDL